MRNIYIFIVFLIFIIRKDSVTLAALSALDMWRKSIFPILFPTFVLADLILSSSIIYYISKYFGKLVRKIFKVNEMAAFVIFISMLCGTPTNVKVLKSMYDSGSIKESDITKTLSFTYLFNPFLIISFAGIKVLVIIWISNLITGVILRNYYVSNSHNLVRNTKKFNLSESISSSVSAIINILGVITVFMCISYAVPFFNPFINVLLTSTLELSTALYKINMYLNYDYFYLIALSLGGISILMQIKSILKDTSIDYKFIILSRIITCIVSLFICWCT